MKFLNLLLTTITFCSLSAQAYNPIIRSFNSVRAAGMGNVRYTTGQFEENLFANPARMTEIKENRFQLPQLSFETSSSTLASLNSILNSGDNNLSGFADAVGEPVYGRFQLFFPGYFSKEFISDRWAFGFGLLFAGQTVAGIGQNAMIDPTTLVNFGPAITLARRLLDDDRLSIGATLHTEYRMSSNRLFSVREFLSGSDVIDVIRGGSGLGFDFDLGATFKPHWTWLDFQYEIGGAINNILGGSANIGSKLNAWPADPIRSHRSYNFGVAARRSNLPVFDQYTFAFEMTDIGNNVHGSLFRTLHLGFEGTWKALAARLGLNQGYFAAGFGMDLGFFDFNLATYGEELGLNAGTVEDRRYALEFGFKI